MSTAKRRRGQSLHLELPNGLSGDLPAVAATFLILFDIKAGYTIAWKQSTPGLELTDSVEFKSLPSGLHDVEEDLIYFLHNDEYAGISAFVNEPAAKSERNALMLAVGALVPLSQGRLGRSWEHAQGLRDLARELAQDMSKTQSLEDFWEKHRWRDGDGSERPALDHDSSSSKEPGQNPYDVNGYARRRSRVLSSASGLIQPGQFLPSHHPALSLPTFLDTFGPLIFPLYKAALLRKRILLVAHAPVEQTCNFVYDISVLSHIPASIFELLPLEPLPTRLQPLFSVGVHDIPTLRQGSRNSGKPTNDASTQDLGYGWVACTTDDVLATKEGLYDMLVTIPPPYTAQAKEKVWPRIESPRGTQVKATQRDLRRYQTLRTGMRSYIPSSSSKAGASSPSPPAHTPQHLNPTDSNSANDSSSSANDSSATETSPLTPLLPHFSNTHETFDDASSTLSATLIEPQSWSALAYSSFMWWASAGEKRADIDDEAAHDAALLDHETPSLSPSAPRRCSASRGREAAARRGVGVEMALVAYFHRLTALVLGVLAECVEAADEEEGGEEGGEEESAGGEGRDGEVGRAAGGDGDEGGERSRGGKVFVGSEDMVRMGLDVWSEGDRGFVRELVGFYWGREAEVGGKGVECCGVRIC